MRPTLKPGRVLPSSVLVGNKIKLKDADNPSEIILSCIETQRKLLSGFKGNSKINLRKLKNAKEPMQFAISLTGEPITYPLINEILNEFHKRKISTFLVTNAQYPEQIKNLKASYLLFDDPDIRNLILG